MRSAPQKQPRPTTACSRPSGNGGAIGLPSTSCAAGTGIDSSRPGSASSAVIIVLGFVKRNMSVSLPTDRNVTPTQAATGEQTKNSRDGLPAGLAPTLWELWMHQSP